MLKSIVISNEEISEIKIKNLSQDNIYKKCGYKNDNNFKKLYEWEFNNSNFIELWGKEELKKSQSKFSIFTKYNINTSGKNIFISRNHQDNKFNSLSLTEFSNFFNLKDQDDNLHDTTSNSDIEINNENLNQLMKKEEIIEQEKIIEQELNDNNSDSSLNSELTLDLYCYSDEND